MNKALWLGSSVILLGLVGASSLRAQELLGADDVLKKIEETAAVGDPQNEFRKKRLAYQKQASAFAPDVAAGKWLELFKEFVTLPEEGYSHENSNERNSLDAVIKALPPTSAWGEIEKQVDAMDAGSDRNAKLALVILMKTLRGEWSQVDKSVEDLNHTLETFGQWGTRSESSKKSALEELTKALHFRMGTKPDTLALFRKNIEDLEEERSGASGYLFFPILGDDVPAGEVEELFGRALRTGARFPSVTDPSTLRRLKAVVMKNPDWLQWPSWNLVETPADAPIYEVLAKKFPQPGEDLSTRSSADEIYLAYLLAEGRATDAVKIFLEMTVRQGTSVGAVDFSKLKLPSQDTGLEFHAALEALLTANPALPFWRTYLGVSEWLGRREPAVTFMKDVIRTRQAGNQTVGLVAEALYADLLAHDSMEEGVEVLRTRIRQGIEKQAVDEETIKTRMNAALDSLKIKLPEKVRFALTKEVIEPKEYRARAQCERCVQLMKIGRLLEKPMLVDEGLAELRKFIGYPGLVSSSTEITSELLAAGRAAQAERQVIENLQVLEDDYYRADELVVLTFIYHQAARPEEVLKLLDHATFWGARDLSGLEDRIFERTSLLLMAADALAKVGRKDAALPIVLRLLQDTPGDDAVYALLLELEGARAETRLDECWRRNRFEERPLIWKAKLQLDQGKVADAEKTIRQAIAIDPSDGEQGRGDRMRAYSVLADILEKSGDAKQAEIMRGAVTAVRLSESADEWMAAGLTTRAVKLYEEALGHFADAYCIESRLALRYTTLGDFAMAEKHYQRAFELMPDSFGHVESHCFGCEGIFSADVSQGVAERVFTQLAKERPEQAQVFYLLGYLREEQGRSAEAAVSYRRAVQLDPEYLNAWLRLGGLSEKIGMAASERDDITLTLATLSPQYSSLSEMADTVKLWDTALAVEKKLPPPGTGPLYPLSESRESSEGRYGGRSWSDPRDALIRNDAIRQVHNIMEALLRGG